MKKLIILVILLSGFSLINAQKNRQDEPKNIEKELTKGIELNLSDTKVKGWTNKNQTNLQKEMNELHAEISKSADKIQMDISNDLAIDQVMMSKVLAMTNIDLAMELHHSYENKDVQQFEGDMFEKLADIKGVEVVYISKSLLGMMPNMNMPGVNISNVVGKLEGLQIFSAETNKTAKILKTEVDRLIKNGKYETIMFIKDGDTKTVFYMKKMKNEKSEMLMVSEEPNEVSVIRFIGKFTIQDIQKITKDKTGKK